MILNKANFVKLLNKNFIFEKNPTVAVGVSGGPDSMALIHLIDHWNKLQKGKVIALIIDHNLRTNSSEETKIIKNFLL